MKKRIVIAVKIPEEQSLQLRSIAEENDVSVSHLVRRAIRDFLAAKEKKDDEGEVVAEWLDTLPDEWP